MEQVLNTPGFFGKVSSHGDFVSRRLPTDFLDAWDSWLQQCVLASKQQLGSAWLTHYLTSPIWRFALDKGVLDRHAWSGVLMPSVDRVGRHFPLMIAAATQANTPMLQWLNQGKAWYDELENLALTSLDSNFMLDEFDAALAAKNSPFVTTEFSGGNAKLDAGWCLPIGSLDKVQGQMSALTSDIAQRLLQGHSLWWTEGSPSIAPSLLVCRGLPTATSFAAMLDGSWRQYGWQ